MENLKVRKVIPRLGVSLSVISGIIIFLVIVLSALIFNFGVFDVIVISGVLALFYVLLLLFFLEPAIIQMVEETKIIEKPIFVEKQVIREVEKPIYIKEQRIHLDIPKYDFLGSTLTQVVHKRSCRIGKSIKRKYKVSDNNLDFFIKQKFKRCKICFKNYTDLT